MVREPSRPSRPSSRGSERRRVLLVADDPTWVLGNQAAGLCRFASSQRVNVDFVTEADFRLGGRAASALARADLVHWLATATWHRYGTDRLAERSIVSIHHVDETETWKPAMRRPRWFCAHSIDGADQVRRRTAHPIDVILPYGFDPTEFSPTDRQERKHLRQRFGIPPEALTVGVFGNAWSTRKGFPLMRQVLHSLDLATLHVAVSGRGWSDRRFELGLPAHRVHDLSTDEAGGLRLKYGALDAYLCASTTEGGPLPVLEALACGIPVASTPVGHVPELANESDAVLIGSAPASLAHALRAHLERGHSTTSPLAIASTVRHRSWPSLAEDYRRVWVRAIDAVTPRKKQRAPVLYGIIRRNAIRRGRASLSTIAGRANRS